ncbi:MAG: TatD family hydrolase [Desulfobacteraceae bacterium]|nr:TatD family hydrolase [Desulfobacteraceae bacterium]
MQSPIFTLVDTHAHLCDPLFDADRAEVLARAAQAGVAAGVAVGENLADARKNLALAAEHPRIKAAAGLYPTHVDMAQAEEMAAFIRAHRADLIAIGEVGLDFWAIQEPVDQEIQRQIFKLFIDLSKELDLPLNIHSRSAGRHAVEMLLQHGAQRVQLHAFDGKAGAALPGVEAGYFFSIPPSVVRSRQKQKLVNQLPLACLLVETDSPVLGPDPGQRNEPANLILAVQAIAEIKSISIAEVAAAVTANTFRLYGENLGPIVSMTDGRAANA